MITFLASPICAAEAKKIGSCKQQHTCKASKALLSQARKQSIIEKEVEECEEDGVLYVEGGGPCIKLSGFGTFLALVQRRVDLSKGVKRDLRLFSLDRLTIFVHVKLAVSVRVFRVLVSWSIT